jgi:hypothetical protein
MFRLTVIGFALLIPAAALAQEVVVYDSVHEGNRPAVDAGIALGYDVHAYESGGEAAWIADVADGADIVVFDVNSNYTAPDALVSLQLNAIADYLNANPDGRAVVALWFMAFEPGHTLWSLMNVSFCSDYTTTIPIYQWDAVHPIWDGIPNPIRNEETFWNVDGAKVEPTGGGIAIGGFTNAPAACQAGLVVNADGSTVYIGETGRGGTYDDDGDSIRDWEELYRNIYGFLLSGPTPTQQSSWSVIKNLYR